MLSSSSKDEPWRAICCFSCSTCALRSSSYCCRCSMREREERRESERKKNEKKREIQNGKREREKRTNERARARRASERPGRRPHRQHHRCHHHHRAYLLLSVFRFHFYSRRTSVEHVQNFFPFCACVCVRRKKKVKRRERGKSKKTRPVTAISERVINLK